MTNAETCDYSDHCTDEPVSGVYHEGREHNFCEYHMEKVSL